MNTNTPNAEQKIIALKRKTGLTFGMAAGLAFAIALWGPDGYMLAQANSYFPWVKLLAGSLLTATVGALAGWLVSRLDRVILSVFIWLGAAGMFAWLAAVVPMVVSPAIMGMLEPKLSPLLNYIVYDNLPTMVGVAFAWIAISAFIIAAIQIPMIDQAVFSVSSLGKVMPHMICAALMLVSGTIVDNLHNKPLRDPVISMNSTIQFALDHRGTTVDPKIAREHRLGSLQEVNDLVTEQRKLVVSSYDALLDNVYVLVNFSGTWVKCGTIVGQPLNCRPLTP